MIRKRFGQHFLEPAWVDKVVRAIAPQPDETFIEIGPGRGALTRPLVARARSVTAFEIDRDLAAHLRAAAIPNLTIVDGDFLGIRDFGCAIREVRDAPEQVGTPANPKSQIPNPVSIRVAGNLPYNVASPMLFRLVDLYSRGVPLLDATVMLQREVAERLVAAPGSRDYGVLSVLIRHSADVELLLKLPPGAFRPPPRVNSALVRLRFHPPDPPMTDLPIFAGIVQAVFTRRRKTLANALLAYGGRESVRTSLPAPADMLQLARLDGRRRPETLTLAEFARLADIYASVSP